jgi:hypothetical protein
MMIQITSRAMAPRTIQVEVDMGDIAPEVAPLKIHEVMVDAIAAPGGRISPAG